MFLHSKKKGNLSSSRNGESRPFIREMWAILLFALALIFFLSLVSYSSDDQLYFAGNQAHTANWIGPGGYLSADFLYSFLGAQAFLVPFLLFLSSYACLNPEKIGIGLHKVIAATLIFFSAGIFFQLALTDRVFGFPAGGLVGLLLTQALQNFVSLTGTIIVSAAFLLIGVLLLTGWTLKNAFATTAAWQAETTKRLFLKPPESFGPQSDAPESASITKPPMSASVKIVEACEEESAKHSTDFYSVAAKPIILPAILHRDFSNDRIIKDAEKSSLEKSYGLPPLNLLDYDAPAAVEINETELTKQGERLCATFRDFGIQGEIREIQPGPVVTLFEFVPAPGVKLSRISALADDIAMAMEAVHVRIVAPIPGKGAVGIELPNEQRETVYLKEIVADPAYRGRDEKLLMALGKDISGKACFANLAEMPHLLIAGTTGSGKSIGLNAMICSILYRATPHDVKFLMIDPKMLELSIYEGIPHLLLPPIIDSKKAAHALMWAVKEMDRRYMRMSEVGVRDVIGYNKYLEKLPEAQKVQPDEAAQYERFPYIVIVVDEYADLVSVAGKEVEELVMRLAQKARACGIHVILATQRPSVDIITGVIKANFPVRMGFRLASTYDSKTIINRSGAEKLLGKGDMLFMPSGTSELMRIHGAYISEKELKRVVEFWASQGQPDYQNGILESEQLASTTDVSTADDKYDQAVEIVRKTNRCSTSWLQRHLSVGYNRAARLIEQMETEGVVGPVKNARGDRDVREVEL